MTQSNWWLDPWTLRLLDYFMSHQSLSKKSLNINTEILSLWQNKKKKQIIAQVWWESLTDRFSSRIPESTCVFPRDGKEQSSEGIKGNATLMLSWILGSHVLSRTLIHGYMFGGRKNLHFPIFCVTKVIAVSVNSTGLEHTFEKLDTFVKKDWYPTST